MEKEFNLSDKILILLEPIRRFDVETPAVKTEDIKEFIKRLKAKLPMILPKTQRLGCGLIHIHTIIDKLVGEKFR